MDVKILFVEDDERLRDVLLEAAAMEEYEARGVSNAEAAVELLRAEPFDVLVTDVTLPGMSGLELLQRLRTSLNDIPVILVSAHANGYNTFLWVGVIFFGRMLPYIGSE